MAEDRFGDPVLLAAVAAAGLLAASFARSSDGRTPAKARKPRQGEPIVPRRPGDVGAVVGDPKPSRAPREPGWWPVLKRVSNGFLDDRIMTEAAGVTFYALLALFPAIATLVSLYGLFADPAVVGQQLQAAAGIIPGGGLDLIETQVKALTANGRTALGWGVALGFFTSLWTANQGIKALFDALNVVFHRRETRSYVRLTLISLGLTFSSIVFILVAMVGVVALPIVLNFVGFGAWADVLLRLARWPLLMAMLGVFLAVIYTYGPDRHHPVWKWVTWGSAFAAVTWVIGSAAFSYYVSNFGSYNKTYGSLGAVIGFMTWIWISMMIVLLGAELNADLEQMEPDPKQKQAMLAKA